MSEVRLIDADALKRYIPTRMDMQDLYLPVHFKTLIDEQPTVDAVPMVRCRDCKYVRVSEEGLFKSGYFCERCHIDSDMENVDDWFCADGERR